MFIQEKQDLIEALQKEKSITANQAQFIIEALESYCELIINFTTNYEKRIATVSRAALHKKQEGKQSP
jgi:hypothetical protein